MKNRFSRILIASTLLGLGLGQTAMAAGFNVRSQSAVGNGLAHAGAGTCAWGPSSTFWNPATITCVPGIQTEANISYVMPDARAFLDGIPGAAGASGDIVVDKFVPSAFSSYQINDRLWIGLATGAPFGAETKLPSTFLGYPANTETDVFNLAATPMVGFQVNDWISVGVGVTVHYLDITLASRAGGVAPVALGGEAFGLGFTAGINLQPWAGGNIGIGYRSSITNNLEGAFFSPAGRTPIDATVVLPDTLTLGIRQDLNEQWSVMGTAQWTNWSRLGRVAVITPTGAPLPGVSPLLFDYEDEYMLSLGAEYRYNANLTLRAGAGYEWSPVSDANRGLRVLDSDRIWVSVGAGYKFSEKLSADISYSHLFFDDGRINPVYAQFPVPGRSEASADIVSVALRYRWDEPAEEPVVRKY
jgi:long-chain fatty acid transport protein